MTFLHWESMGSGPKNYGLLTTGDNPYGELFREDIAVSSDSAQYGWGRTKQADNWIDGTGGEYTTMLVKDDGTLWIVGGSSGSSNLTQIGTLTNWQSVYGRSSENSLLALNTSGNLYRITLPSTTTQLGSGIAFTYAAGSVSFYWAISSSGQLYSGANTAGNGYSQIGKSSIAFGITNTSTNWTQVECGRDYTLALNSLGQVWGCGRNDNNQLAGLTGATTTLRQLPIGTGWTYIAAGQVDNWGIKSDGSIWTWGANDGATPILVDDSRVYVSVKAGFLWQMAKDVDGYLYGWGYNGGGALGIINTVSVFPLRLLLNDPVSFYRPANSHSLAFVP
jgi:alpha-tubulin suppressor-like RCC1 family protein